MGRRALLATPIDLGRLIDPAKPIVRVRYELEESPETPIPPLLDRIVERARAALVGTS